VTGRLSGMPSVRGSWLARWDEYWFDEIPPHSMALLRIVFGAMALAGLVGLTPVDMFWSLDGLTPLPGNPEGARSWLIDRGLADWAGRAYFAGSVIAAIAMTVGFRSDLAVVATFVGLWGQIHWNRLPLSSAHQVVLVVLFCLLWTDTGRVWSLDARRRAALGGDPGDVPVWPLRLIRCQVSLIYLGSALWKLLSPAWRDGSAVYWALNLNTFHRFPWPIPIAAEPYVAFLTWGTLLFELSFPVLVWFRATRLPTLALGIAMHLGLWLALELGPFSWVMMASYIAFLDPIRDSQFQNRWRTSTMRPAALPSHKGGPAAA
jgi:hypothetical protein